MTYVTSGKHPFGFFVYSLNTELQWISCHHNLRPYFTLAGEIDISYLYVKDKPIEWPFVKYTWYFSLKYGLGVLSLVVVLPLCSRAPDMLLVASGLLSKVAGLVFLALAWNDATIFSSKYQYFITSKR